METLPKRTVVETLEASEEYASNLESLLNSLITAETQVERSASTASQQVEAVFQTVTDFVLKGIEDRKQFLLKNIACAQEEALKPLQQCRKDVTEKIAQNKGLILEAKGVLKIGGFKSQENCFNFQKLSSGLGVLPAVPEVELIPNITFQGHANDILPTLKDAIDDFGKVFKIGPVQIISMDPKPGALLIKWADVDFDCIIDDQCYRLQMTLGEDANCDLFRDIYLGPDTEFLVTNLKYLQKYSFKVCVGNTTASGWSSWSVVKTSFTNVPAYVWDSSNLNFSLSDDNRLARVITPESVLFSHGAQIASGNSVQFTLFSNVEPLSEEGVGITVSKMFSTPTLAQPGAFFVSFLGDVYIDGDKKIISLPKMSRGSKIIFSCELVNGRWRVNVESGCKAVTYEWIASSLQLFFATSLSQPDIQVLVE